MNASRAERPAVDWDFAVATGARLVRPGPVVSRLEAREAVAALRQHAVTAQRHVRETTGLVAPTGADGGVAVIDRPGWIRANADGFRTLFEPVVERMRQKRPDKTPSAAGAAVGAKVTAVETGTLLAFLASRILGQYELFPPFGSAATAPAGRLLLVAPNIVEAERQMGVDPADFRLWVCVHEETHRVQFGAVPWLRAYVLGEISRLLEETDLDGGELLTRVRTAAAAVRGAVREDDDGGSLLEAMQTPAQKEILDRLTAVMSLLEGHADYVMDAVGPQVIPTVGDIRAKFQQRRAGAGRRDRVLRRLLGLEAKMRQYRDGAAFVSAAVDEVGMAGFNTVWDRVENLPTLAEIHDPAAWVDRVSPRALPA